MRPVSLFVFFVLSHLGTIHLAQEKENSTEEECQHHPKPCGNLGTIKFPFRLQHDIQRCGLLAVNGCSVGDTPKIQLKENCGWSVVENISQADSENISQADSVFIHEETFGELLKNRSCETFTDLGFIRNPFLSIRINPSLTLLKCEPGVYTPPSPNFSTNAGCSNFNIFYNPEPKQLEPYPPQCELLQLPAAGLGDPSPNEDIFSLLTANFMVDVIVSPDCKECYRMGEDCWTGKIGEFQCSKPQKRRRKKLALSLGLGLGLGVPFIMTLVVFVLFRQHKKKHGPAKLLSTSSNSDPSKDDLEGGSVYFGVSVFSYSELEEATNNFSSENELGDGGFGTVYYGKLKDGREVAVKRMYEHNFRRVVQFRTEIEILTKMRHRNLVSLYGCTSRRSKELLLVYEYIHNGTVADHLHGDRTKSYPLTWPIRLNIAVETASALAYLHASDIVHRDVKTNNILLDKNFCVKVADFGLSRGFPNDVTHVSTCPQGTPGYVDPEYHQCYQLTVKSDVYSFGVVLIELISSMPAVDITRDRSDINLANLAIKKIQKCEFDELIDPNIGYKSNEEIKRMATAVAGLAFQCLQQEKDMRPTMVEVLNELIQIQGGDSEKNLQEFQDMNDELKNRLPPPSPQECDEHALLKNTCQPSSPISVADKWISSSCGSTTPNVSS